MMQIRVHACESVHTTPLTTPPSEELSALLDDARLTRYYRAYMQWAVLFLRSAKWNFIQSPCNLEGALFQGPSSSQVRLSSYLLRDMQLHATLLI